MVNFEAQEDTELMIRVSRGDEAAFAAVVRRYRTRLLGFFVSLGESPEAAEDMAQEALMRLWIARERYEPSAAFSTYLFQIARNCWLNALRSRKRRPVAEPVNDEDSDSRISPMWPWNPVFNAYRMREVRRTIVSLPQAQREVFVLCHLQGFTCAQAASILEIPVGTVKSRMSAAVHRLRDLLEQWSEP